MKIESVEILGKKLQLQLGLKTSELQEVNRKINKRLKSLMVEYPNLDKIDILSFYIVELHEEMYNIKTKLAKEEKRFVKISGKLLSIENRIKKEIEKLDIETFE
ncbi:cell division protein ZapA [bacterium]|nr:cell division protein ZapA [bacterium]